MRDRFSGSMITVAIAAAAVSAVISVSVTRTSGQARPQAAAARPASRASPISAASGKPITKPTGICRRMRRFPPPSRSRAFIPMTTRGCRRRRFSRSAPPAPCRDRSASCRATGRSPTSPKRWLMKKENAEHWIDRDPELKCYLPGIPRAMYMPYPFQITQSTNKIHIAYEFSNTARTIHLDKVEGPPDDTWMGHSVGRWDGDTLVVDVTNFNDRSWFDRAGNFHSDALHLVERFTLMSPDIIWYEVTIEDPKVFTRPWRIAMPLYRRVEPNMQLLEFRCNEFVEEFMYGNLRKTAVGQALGRRYHDDRYHAQGAARRPLLSVVR